jgi:hypothetical protein
MVASPAEWTSGLALAAKGILPLSDHSECLAEEDVGGWVKMGTIVHLRACQAGYHEAVASALVLELGLDLSRFRSGQVLMLSGFLFESHG